MQYGLLVALVCVAFYSDVRTSTIPNRLTVNATMIAIIYHVIKDGWSGCVFSLLGCGVGIGIFMIMYVFKALGAGDVKLFGAIGALMGMEFTLYSMMYAVLYSGVVGVVILLYRQQFIAKVVNLLHYFFWAAIGKSMSSLNYTKQHSVLTFPFMYAVVPAIVTTSYFLH